jgi:sugar/nucleoside kinase (ribokinase family)
MKFLVLGHFSYDIVHDPAGGATERPGGLHAAITTLAGLCTRQDRIVPCFGVGTADLAAVVSGLRQCENVDPSAIYPIETPTHRVRYFGAEDGTRAACPSELAPPIPFDRLKKLLDVDGILINMVSGADLRLETLDEIRMAVRGSGTKIHLDYHNLTCGIGEAGKRHRRPLPDWRRWAFMVDTLQLNEEEIAGLTPEKQDERATAGHLLTLSTRGVIVTRGGRGSTLYYSEHKKVLRADFAPETILPGEQITAGDRFGAAFLYHYCRTGDCPAAAKAATIAGLEGT